MTVHEMSVESELFEKVNSLMDAIQKVPENSCANLETEIAYIGTVRKDLKVKLQNIRQQVKKVVEGVVDHKDFHLIEDYPADITEKLDYYAEIIDHALDGVRGKNANTQSAEVASVISKKRKWLSIEKDPAKVATLSSNEIFVPESHPHLDLINGLYRKDNIVRLFEDIPYEKNLCPETLNYIDTVVDLDTLAAALEKEDVVAVDLENHSFQSFHGFLCLMQISTRSMDYVIDIIKLRSQIGTYLRPFFANPSIIKVFHGAQSDILWLQRDFNIFIVNMFDTYFAAKALQKGGLSLAFLISHYCQVTVDKYHQLSDWRTRPLPDDMIEYARMDTHYLLYIFSKLTQELEKESKLREVLQQSSLSALALYRPDESDENGWKRIIAGKGNSFSGREKNIIKAIYLWRIEVGRIEDHSPPAVLPNHFILRMAQQGASRVEAILTSAKNPPQLALKHIETLKLAFRVVFDDEVAHSNNKIPKVEQKNATPTHTKFNDEGSPLPQPAGKVPQKEKTSLPTPAKRICLAPVAPKSSSLSSFLNSSKKEKIFKEADSKIAESMPIVKVRNAAITLLKTAVPANSEEKVEEPSVIEERSEDSKVVFTKSGKTADAEELISTAIKTSDRKISLANPKSQRRKDPSGEEIDINIEDSAKLLLSKEKSVPAHTEATKDGSSKEKKVPKAQAPRLGKAPQSGKRSMTFKLQKNQ